MSTTTATTMTTTNAATEFALKLRPQHPHATVDDLPNELLLDITAYLSLRTVISLLQVNRRWRAVVSLAATAGLPETTKKLFNVWLAWNALSFDNPLDVANLSGKTLQGTPQSLTNAQRDQYVTLVGRYAIAYQCVSREEPGLSNEFLEWLYEWPSCAALPLPLSTVPKSLTSTTTNDPHKLAALGGPLSPSSVVNALTRSSSYCTNPRVTFGDTHAQPSYYYQEHIIFLIALEDDDVLLPRVRLHQETISPPVVQGGKEKGKQRAIPAKPHKIIKCSMLNGGPGSFVKGDWARFLPISTVKRAPGSEPPLQHDLTGTGTSSLNDGDPKTPLPLYVLSGSGLGEKLAGSVCMLQENAELKVVANSWAGYLMFLVERRKIDMARVKVQVQASTQRVCASSKDCKKSLGGSMGELGGSSSNVKFVGGGGAPSHGVLLLPQVKVAGDQTPMNDGIPSPSTPTSQVVVQTRSAPPPVTPNTNVNANPAANPQTTPNRPSTPIVSDTLKKLATNAPSYTTNEEVLSFFCLLEFFALTYGITFFSVFLKWVNAKVPEDGSASSNGDLWKHFWRMLLIQHVVWVGWTCKVMVMFGRVCGTFFGDIGSALGV